MNSKCKYRSIIGLLFALIFISTPSNAEDVPHLLRVAVIDDSGSMAGERIACVRDELAKAARQLPPSHRHPIVLVTFGLTAAPAVTFTDLASFEAALALLKGGSGGTNIAAGMIAAVEQLKRQRSAQDVWVILYTDGEDSNFKGIQKAEESLDSVFADRQQHHLPQTVFCKRWGNANAQLLQQIQARGRATVVDAGEMNVRPLTFTPVIEATSVAWDQDDPNQLNVAYAVHIDVQGDVDGLTLPVLKTKCVLASVTGDIETEVIPAGTIVNGRKIQLRITPDDRKAGQLLLPFTCTSPGDISSTGSKVLSQLATSSVDVPIKLPLDKYVYRISSELNPGMGTWVDTVDRRVRFPAKLKLLVTCREGIHGPPGEVELVPEPDTVLVSGPPTLKLPSSGVVEADYVIETSVKNSSGPRDLWGCSFGFEGRPVNSPPNMTFEPPVWTIHADAAVPAPITTTIVGRALNVSTPQWSNLAQGIAKFDVDAEFDVQGPISANTIVNLLTSGSAVSLKMEPSVLRTGIQRVCLSFTAALRPAPDAILFESCILAPRGNGVISYQAGPPINFTVTGPSAAKLSLARDGRPLKELRVSIADNDRHVRLPIELTVVGYRNSPAIGNLKVMLKPQGTTLNFLTLDTYRIDRRHTFDVTVSAPAERSFFRDIALTGTVDVGPDNATTAVTSVTIPIRVIAAAPFKRLALYLAIGLSVVVTTVVWVRLLLALRRVD